MSRFEEIEIKGCLDTNNSSSTPLGAGATFTGTAIDVTNCGILFVNVFADQNSASDGLSLEQSSDGTNWDHVDTYTILANTGKNYSINPHAKYFRVKYTNGGTIQTAFRLQTICKSQNAKASSHRIKDEIVGDDDAVLVKAAITGENGSGDWHNVKVTQDGDLKISDNSNGLAIAEGNVTGKTYVHVFGLAIDFDTGDNAVNVWDGADDSLFSGSPPMTYTFSSTADIDTISSSDAGDTVDIEIKGLDTNWEEVTQTVTLSGQTDVSLTTALIRVFSMENVGATDLAGNVYLRTNGSAQTAGVPDTANTVRALIKASNNRTLMAIYTIPAGKTGYMRSGYAHTAGANRESNYIISLKTKNFGSVFAVRHVAAVDDDGTSAYQHHFIEPAEFAEKTDIMVTAQVTKAATAAASIAAGFDMVLKDN